MKTSLAITLLFFLSIQAYSQIQSEANNTCELERCEGHVAAPQTPYSRTFLIERSIAKSSRKKYEDYLKSESGVRVALKLKDSLGAKGINDKNMNSESESTRVKFYFKIEKGEWKDSINPGLPSTPAYVKKSILCLISRKEDRKNRKFSLELACGDFCFPK